VEELVLAVYSGSLRDHPRLFTESLKLVDIVMRQSLSRVI
jgi:hypothetical protein